MTLKERLREDFLTHYKAQHKAEVTVLRAMTGAIETEEKSGKAPAEFSDEQVQALIGREVKKRKATAEEYRQAGADERADSEAWEADFLAQYLPAQLSDDDVRVIVHDVISENENAHMGLVMKSVMGQVKGQADGKLVRQIVQEELAKKS